MKNTLSILLGFFIVLVTAFSAYADASWAEVAAGGIQFKATDDISIEREDLYVSQDIIKVSYSFHNHTDEDKKLLVAFPVPVYSAYDVIEDIVPSFNDFSVSIDGRDIKYNKEVRALAGGKDCTEILSRLNISIEDYGWPDNFDDSRAKLNEADRMLLEKEGVVEFDYDETGVRRGHPSWEVSIKYYWEQVFPANSTILIEHTYAPLCGGGPISYDFDKSGKRYLADGKNLLKFECLDDETASYFRQGNDYVTREALWVSYILTTANNWKKPMKEFHLTVDKKDGETIAACFDGKLQQTGPLRYEAFVKDFVPTQDLMVVFIGDKEEDYIEKMNNEIMNEE